MKTVKEVSALTGISIRTLRYYDEIGLLRPTQITQARYRLYDEKALTKLQEIMFFRELEVPLEKIKKIMENPEYTRKQALLTQKDLLIRKRNHLNGLIELINNIIEGVDTMNFEPFNKEDAEKIVEHSISFLENDEIDAITTKYGSLDEYRSMLEKDLMNEETSAHLIKIYGSKDKALEASLQADGNIEKQKQYQDEIHNIYKQFYLSMLEGNTEKKTALVVQLEKEYKEMFRLDDARYLLLEVAKDLVNKENKLTQATDEQYGTGTAEYIGNAISEYYGM